MNRITIIKNVNQTLENHKGMSHVTCASTTNGGKQRLGLFGTAFRRLSVSWLRVHGYWLREDFSRMVLEMDAKRR
jgi:hypothetical protein